MDALKSGVVLCKVANLVKPGVIASKKIKVPSAAAAASAAATSTMSSSSSTFGAMDNVAEFRNACKLIGVKEQVSSSSSSFLFSLSSEDGVRCVVCAWIDLAFLFSLCCGGVGHLLGE